MARITRKDSIASLRHIAQHLTTLQLAAVVTENPQATALANKAYERFIFEAGTLGGGGGGGGEGEGDGGEIVIGTSAFHPISPAPSIVVFPPKTLLSSTAIAKSAPLKKPPPKPQPDLGPPRRMERSAAENRALLLCLFSASPLILAKDLPALMRQPTNVVSRYISTVCCRPEAHKRFVYLDHRMFTDDEKAVCGFDSDGYGINVASELMRLMTLEAGEGGSEDGAIFTSDKQPYTSRQLEDLQRLIPPQPAIVDYSPIHRAIALRKRVKRKLRETVTKFRVGAAGFRFVNGSVEVKVSYDRVYDRADLHLHTQHVLLEELATVAEYTESAPPPSREQRELMVGLNRFMYAMAISKGAPAFKATFAVPPEDCPDDPAFITDHPFSMCRNIVSAQLFTGKSHPQKTKKRRSGETDSKDNSPLNSTLLLKGYVFDAGIAWKMATKVRDLMDGFGVKLTLGRMTCTLLVASFDMGCDLNLKAAVEAYREEIKRISSEQGYFPTFEELTVNSTELENFRDRSFFQKIVRLTSGEQCCYTITAMRTGKITIQTKGATPEATLEAARDADSFFRPFALNIRARKKKESVYAPLADFHLYPVNSNVYGLGWSKDQLVAAPLLQPKTGRRKRKAAEEEEEEEEAAAEGEGEGDVELRGVVPIIDDDDDADDAEDDGEVEIEAEKETTGSGLDEGAGSEVNTAHIILE